jgi:hypothetical protein
MTTLEIRDFKYSEEIKARFDEYLRDIFKLLGKCELKEREFDKGLSSFNFTLQILSTLNGVTLSSICTEYDIPALNIVPIFFQTVEEAVDYGIERYKLSK